MLATPAWASEADNAKALFDKGVTFFEAGNTERALDYFLRSRDQQATVDNTLNVAICLARLERHDEALQMYETALADYADRLTANEKNALAPAMKRLRAQVGSLQLSTNVAGSVVVDGRLRGTLPLSLPPMPDQTRAGFQSSTPTRPSTNFHLLTKVAWFFCLSSVTMTGCGRLSPPSVLSVPTNGTQP